MTARIYVMLDETMFDVGFDCPGVTRCKYALCEEMPIVNADEVCTFNKNCTCYCADAQIAAIESVRRRLSKHAKSIV